jgi:hypothetical protein
VEQHRFPLNVADADIDVIGQSLLWVAVQARIADMLEDSLDKAVAEDGETRGFFRHFLSGNFGGLAEAGNRRYILGAASPVPFLSAAMHEGD